MRPSARATIAIGLTALVTGACTAPSGAGPTTSDPATTLAPGSPVIAAFSAVPATTAPTAVTYRWTVSDPTDDPLTCTLDKDGNGTVDLTVADCAGTKSRNLMVTTAGPATPMLSVSDGAITATATASMNLGTAVVEPYDILIRPVGVLDPAVSAAFTAASARWRTVVTRGVADTTVNVGAGVCGANSTAFSGALDDLAINVEVAPIDGVGGVLGAAGPCLVAAVDGLPRVGSMRFDSADAATLLAGGLFEDVVLHEMGHVLGFGVIWTAKGVIQGQGTAGSAFTGQAAVAEWTTLGRSGLPPLDHSGLAGTADSHWDEAVFDNELMTGFLDNGSNPLGILTVASLADLDYHVDLAAADVYQLPGPALRSFAYSADPVVGRVELLEPIGTAPTT